MEGRVIFRDVGCRECVCFLHAHTREQAGVWWIVRQHADEWFDYSTHPSRVARNSLPATHTNLEGCHSSKFRSPRLIKKALQSNANLNTIANLDEVGDLLAGLILLGSH